MKLIFKQRMFSWFDSYDIYNERDEVVYSVKGQLSWGHCFKIFDAYGNELGMVQQQIFTFLPKFCIYQGDQHIGTIKKEFSLFSPQFTIDYNGWDISGDFFEWDYNILSVTGQPIACISKELFNWTDTYLIDINNPEDSLMVLMLVLAIDAEKCSRNN